MLKTKGQPMIISSFVNPLAENCPARSRFNLLQKLRQYLDEIEINNRQIAKLIAKLIPAQCPFERDIVVFGRKIAHIPPLCKFNPLYDQFVGLRFRALCYLVDKCGEDI
ncbi:MAG: Mo-dependent nitrogenase C-terminal domain-containing protein, partial [Dolichospermum sp.]